MMKICYINFNIENPRDQITLRGFRENNIVVTVITDQTPGWKKYIILAKKFRNLQKDYDVVMVGYAGSVLVIMMRLLTRKPVIYNALATFYDSMILSRFGGRRFSLSALWYYMIDFFTFRMATHSFIECESQKKLVVSVFKINPHKISVHFVGTDDEQFYFDSQIKKLKNFTVVFRGMFLPEAGVDVVIRAAKKLEQEHVQFRIMGRGLLLQEIQDLMSTLQPNNVELITARLPIEELRQKMLECHISLGQLADHPRVHTTIPHKAFESMSMKLPYLTGANKGVMEILTDNETCFLISPGSSEELAQKILELKNNPQKLEEVAREAHALYLREYTPKVLAQKIINQLKELS